MTWIYNPRTRTFVLWASLILTLLIAVSGCGADSGKGMWQGGSDSQPGWR